MKDAGVLAEEDKLSSASVKTLSAFMTLLSFPSLNFSCGDNEAPSSQGFHRQTRNRGCKVNSWG